MSIRRHRWASVVAGLTLVATQPALATEYGTRDEARELVGRAVELFSAIGENAFTVFTNCEQEFCFLDLYVFVADVDNDGNIAAHGWDRGQIGMNCNQLPPFCWRMLREATETGVWFDYETVNPRTGVVEPKSSWVVRYDRFIFGVGVHPTSRGW